MVQAQSQLTSIREQEKIYEREIRSTYKNYPHLFTTHSSDMLHLKLVQKQIDGTSYKTLVAKSAFNKYDMILELRGSIIKYDTLRKLIENKTVSQARLPLLLYLNWQSKYLISPKNISKYLFTHPLYSKSKGNYGEDSLLQGNCFIQNHYGSKLLAVAARDIAQGEQLILEQKSYDNTVYSYSAVEF